MYPRTKTLSQISHSSGSILLCQSVPPLCAWSVRRWGQLGKTGQIPQTGQDYPGSCATASGVRLMPVLSKHSAPARGPVLTAETCENLPANGSSLMAPQDLQDEFCAMSSTNTHGSPPASVCAQFRVLYCVRSSRHMHSRHIPSHQGLISTGRGNERGVGDIKPTSVNEQVRTGNAVSFRHFVIVFFPFPSHNILPWPVQQSLSLRPNPANPMGGGPI